MLLESEFQANLIRKIKEEFPGAVVLKNDPTYLVGIPDLTILFNQYWAVLDPKRSRRADRGYNQKHYIRVLNDMSYAAFVYPENEDEVLDGLQQTFGFNR